MLFVLLKLRKALHENGVLLQGRSWQGRPLSISSAAPLFPPPPPPAPNSVPGASDPELGARWAQRVARLGSSEALTETLAFHPCILRPRPGARAVSSRRR